MDPDILHFSVDPFQITYENKSFPITPDGHPTSISDFPAVLINGSLCCIPYILSGEVSSLAFLDDPHQLLLIPWGGEVTIVLRTELTEYYKNWQQITIPTGKLLFAILETAKQYIDEIQMGSMAPEGASIYTLTYLYNLSITLSRSHGYIGSPGLYS